MIRMGNGAIKIMGLGEDMYQKVFANYKYVFGMKSRSLKVCDYLP